jgi:iron complex transport system ATP-binding protein
VTCDQVTVRRGDRRLLDAVSWQVGMKERWVILGPNGAGKTTLLLIASTRLFPTTGEVDILGERLGAVDLSELRPFIGWASSAVAPDIPPAESVRDVVITGAFATTGRWREDYSAQDIQRGESLLAEWGIESLAGRTFGTLSEGERKRCLIARALMSNPELLLLDEPGAGLDLGGREDLVMRLGNLARDPRAPTQVVVTHHVEEIPVGFTHALLLRAGRVVAQGPVASVISDENLTAAFGLPLVVQRQDGRFSARRAPA